MGMRGVGLVRGVGRPPLALRQSQHERPSPRGWIPALGGRNDGIGWVGMMGVGLGRGVGCPPLALRQSQHERPSIRGWIPALGGRNDPP